jgi:hypothetical protein
MPPADTRRVVPTPPHALRRSASSRHCACTFYLVFKEPATWWFALSPFGPFATTFPTSFISLRGTLQSYRAFTFPSTLFSLQRRFFRGAFERPHRMQAKFSPCPVALRARGATWECELEEVFRLRADALRRNESRSVQPIYAARRGLSTQATARIVSSSKPS